MFKIREDCRECICKPLVYSTISKRLVFFKQHTPIKIFKPRLVEILYHKDNEMFYAKKTFYSLEDYNKQLRRYMNEYNNFPMRPLGWKSPNEYLYL